MPGGMEPEVKQYLRKVGYSFFAGLVWLFFNVTLGIYFRLAIIEGGLSVWNLVFYLLFLASTGLLLLYFARTWRSYFSSNDRK